MGYERAKVTIDLQEYEDLKRKAAQQSLWKEGDHIVLKQYNSTDSLLLTKLTVGDEATEYVFEGINTKEVYQLFRIHNKQ